MNNQKKLIVSNAPFLHNGSNICQRSYHIILATIPALLHGLFRYGMPAVALVCLSISSAIIWELLMNKAMKQDVTIGDGNAALIGILFAMLLPATSPWWLVITGTFIAIVIGKHIFGGIGSNPFNPVAVSIAILMVSWQNHFDFNEALVNYDMDFAMIYPLAALKYFGLTAIEDFSIGNLIIGKQSGGIGTALGLGLILGGIYLIIKGFIRWEISVSFVAGIIITASIFHISNPSAFASPLFHLFTGYTLIGIFFLATEDSSSPVNFIPMIIYGAGCGLMTILIRNIGAYIDGVILSILLMNLLSPLLDKIRPKVIGEVA